MSSTPPSLVERLIVHQFDPARPSPGGIDTCLRGISKYLPRTASVAFVGVDTGEGPAGRKLGQWEVYERNGSKFHFLPVVTLDPANQSRRIPHSLRLVLGVLRYRKKIPRAKWVQTHRMDTGWSVSRILPGKRAYFIHTQENGLTGNTSDSFWRLAGVFHRKLEQSVVTKADQIVVFNEDYAKLVHSWNQNTQYSPTWFDPDLIHATENSARDPFRILWVGRLEVPKDPKLAVDAFADLVRRDPNSPWKLDILGSGTLLGDLKHQTEGLPAEIASRINLRGRVAHPGYEGYPRVLVESLASGLLAVATAGSDTGHLIVDRESGFVTSRDPVEIAERLREATAIGRDKTRMSVSHLSAPQVIASIYQEET
jgi:glycosyltransferase involved in cell wall biosynthesis